MERILPCEKGQYLVLLPNSHLEEEQVTVLAERVQEYLHREGFRPYYKAGASVTELAENCEELLKPLLTP
ncbi:MAG: hypothetical protein N2170_06100 [Bacteroidia bacterium]|nr:hypothetical protein [Bacteroidia bacterium]